MTEDLEYLSDGFLGQLGTLSGHAPHLGRPGQYHDLPSYNQLESSDKIALDDVLYGLKEAGVRMPDFPEGGERRIYDDLVKPRWDAAPIGEDGVKQITVSELLSPRERGQQSSPSR